MSTAPTDAMGRLKEFLSRRVHKDKVDVIMSAVDKMRSCGKRVPFKLGTWSGTQEGKVKELINSLFGLTIEAVVLYTVEKHRLYSTSDEEQPYCMLKKRKWMELVSTDTFCEQLRLQHGSQLEQQSGERWRQLHDLLYDVVTEGMGGGKDRLWCGVQAKMGPDFSLSGVTMIRNAIFHTVAAWIAAILATDYARAVALGDAAVVQLSSPIVFAVKPWPTIWTAITE